ncbi:hypothetical protein ACXU4B_00565 [Dyella soli]|uniref:Uncharacterized protein n=1 Tax=Dyella soli TaxID=522319 RepID=A0A4R0YS04_9GAMM|nr:hypothetical protein [Dyella soli]TCI09573.1 hypothetical protein EZM97_11435 [Dyella soli]
MSHEYRSLPIGPVMCDTCFQSGEKVEMLPHPRLPPEDQAWSDAQHVELQSYRCPECEGVQVFRVD